MTKMRSVVLLGAIVAFGCGSLGNSEPADDLLFNGASVVVQDEMQDKYVVDFEVMQTAFDNMVASADELGVEFPDLERAAREEGLRIGVVSLDWMRKFYGPDTLVEYTEEAPGPTIYLAYHDNLPRSLFGLMYTHGLLHFALRDPAHHHTEESLFGPYNNDFGFNSESIEGLVFRELMRTPQYTTNMIGGRNFTVPGVGRDLIWMGTTCEPHNGSMGYRVPTRTERTRLTNLEDRKRLLFPRYRAGAGVPIVT